MDKISSIAVLGTYDTKGEEHLFIKERVEKQGLPVLMINVGTKKPASCDMDLDLFTSLHDRGVLSEGRDRDEMIQAMLQEAGDAVKTLYNKGEICGIVSAGGGSGTHLCTGIMRVLPLYDPDMNDLFIQTFKHNLAPAIPILKEGFHINDLSFAKTAADMMDEMIVSKNIP